MNLTQAFRLSPSPCLALVGAGGKTTALFQLANELSSFAAGRPPAPGEVEGSPVIVTTTTHLGAWQIPARERHLIVERSANLAALEKGLPSGATIVTGPRRGDRFGGISPDVQYWLRASCRELSLPLLIEADGARQKPLKAPAEHEPPIPPFVETVVVAAGLSALGKELSEEWVHRIEHFKRIGGSTNRQSITIEMVARGMMHESGGLKNIPTEARRVALLNQADTPELQSQARGLADILLGRYDAVIIAALKSATEPGSAPAVHAVVEPVAGMILAAGESRRYGSPKQLLEWRGKPFVRHVAEAALTAGLSPVVLIVGAYAEEIEPAVARLPLTIVRNPNWQRGQSTSIRAGLQALPANTGASIFLLADQPQVTSAVLRGLVDSHAATMAPITAPLVLERRANPILFDRATFPDLMALTGDVGGRAIFGKHRLDYLPWHDESLLADVDTPADYLRLVARG